MPLMRKLLSAAKTRVKRSIRPLIQNVGLPPSRLTPERWQLTENDDQGLKLRGTPLQQLVAQWGSPLHVVDAEALRSNVRSFLMPHGKPSGCEVFYSYKTNPIPGMLRLMHDLGVGAEAISHYELWLAQRMGMPPERIVYNGPGKSTESIREAVALGLQIINLNHAEEIDRIVPIARELGKKPRVGLRVTTGDGWTSQFGTPIRDGAALAAYTKAVATGALDVVGLHAHLGGMIHTKERLLLAVNGVLDFVEDMENKLGISLEILNFGGSLATPTVQHISPLARQLNQTFHRDLPEPDADASLKIEDHVSALVACVRERYQRRSRPVPRIFLEPGRSMTGNTQMLVASVISSKKVNDGNFLILDAGINLAESVRNEYHHMFPVKGWKSPKTETYTVVGPICSPGDTLYYAWRSRKLADNESVVIMDAGGYFVPFATSFSFPQPGIVVLDNGKVTQWRRPEQFDDLIAFDTPASFQATSQT